MKTLSTWVAAAATVAMTGAAQAALIDRGGGMIYDTTRDITWLADMNYAFTSGYAAANAGGDGANSIVANGRMGWNAAVAWANQLVFGGFDDWRLPTINAGNLPCSVASCAGGELTGLFATDLGNKPGESVLNQAGDTDEQKANLALFTNVQVDSYWSGTQSSNSSFALLFITNGGGAAALNKANPLYAVAVRSGDVPASVPEPQTLALALLGLGAAVAARRRRSR